MAKTHHFNTVPKIYFKTLIAWLYTPAYSVTTLKPRPYKGSSIAGVTLVFLQP